MSKDEVKRKGRLPANVNLESKPAPGNAFVVIDSGNKKILMRVAVGCRRDTNPEKDGFLQELWKEAGGKGQLQLSRYEAVSEPYFIAKLGRKGDFVPVTFLCGPGHKKCLGFEGIPTDANIKKALKDKKLLRYEWTAEDYLVAVAAGKQVFELRDGDAVEVNLTPAKAKEMIKAKADRDKAREAAKPKKIKKPAAKKKPAKKATKKTVAKEAKASGAVKKPAAKRVTWYQAIDGKIKKKRSTKQPEGFHATEKDAKLNRIVSEPVAAEAAE